jgi:HK97 family phage portal protein
LGKPLLEIFNLGGPAHPSQQVQGAERVLGLAAVYSAVRYIADAVASLPILVYRTGRNGEPVKVPYSPFLTQPGVAGTAYDWKFTCMSSALLWGNAWGLITSRSGLTAPNGLGYPTSVEWLPPDRVSVQDDEQQPENPMRARVYYNGAIMNRDNLVHVRAFPVAGKLEGISPMRAFATLYAQGLSALDYSAEWFRNGGFPPGVFKNQTEEVDAEQSREIRRMLTDVLRARQPLVIGKDWEYTAINVPPNEAVFVQAMQLNATQVAAIYGLPAEKVGGTRGSSLTYSTVVQETISLITDTLRPWLMRLEDLFTQLLPGPQYAKFDTDSLLKTDLKTRNEIWEIQRNMGTRTADELRAYDDLPPLPDGVGAETIPLSIAERMAASARAIPKSMIGQLVLETEIAAQLLEKLQKEGLTSAPVPGVPPIPMSPESYLGHQVTLARMFPDGQKEVRATGSDRDRAARHIRAACAAGCLDPDEQDTRVSNALKAGTTRGQLNELTADLPPENELATTAGGGVNGSSSRAGDKPRPLFGPAALALLHARSIDIGNTAEPPLAAMNGKDSGSGSHLHH